MRSIEELKRQDVAKLCREILNDEFLENRLISISILDKPNSQTLVKTCFESDKDIVNVESPGHGFVDAMFASLKEEYSPYKTLADLRLVSFEVSPHSTLRGCVNIAGPVKARLQFKIRKAEVEFQKSSRSMISAIAMCLLSAFQFYVNCEKAFVKLRGCILNAKERNRQDIVSSLSYKMSTLTRVNTFEETIQ